MKKRNKNSWNDREALKKYNERIKNINTLTKEIEILREREHQDKSKN